MPTYDVVVVVGYILVMLALAVFVLLALDRHTGGTPLGGGSA